SRWPAHHTAELTFQRCAADTPIARAFREVIMLDSPNEHRHLTDRRASGRGGRRASDLPRRPFHPPTCPKCRVTGAALPAGDSDGGWWFVCLCCDHLWDQRQIVRAAAITSERPVTAS